MDTYNSFFTGIQEALTNSGNVTLVLITVLLMGILMIVIYYIYRGYQNSLMERKLLETREGDFKPPPRHLSGFNPAQKRVLNSLIMDFKRREIIASAIPSSVLERYSEFFFQHFQDLRISDETAQRIAKKIYPIAVKSSIEIEINDSNRLFVLEREALESNERAVVVHNISGLPHPIKKGVPVNVCYTSNNMFICGQSAVQNFLPNGKTVLSYPKNLKISQERLYSRIPVENINGSIIPADIESDASPLNVTIKDISLEGVRVQASSNLKRKETYRLSFTDMTLEKTYDFDNLECVISKSYMIENGVYEYGLSFVYLDLETRNKLFDYFRALAVRLQKDVVFKS